MPDTDATPTESSSAAPNETPKPAVEFVPSAEFKAFQDTIGGSMKQMAETLEGVRALIASGTKPVPTTPDAKVYITPAQYAQAVAEGNTEIIARWAGEQEEKRDLASRGLIEEVRGVTTGTAEPIAKRVGIEGLKFYARFKDEIDKRVAGLPAAVRSNPETYRAIHNIVVGEHHEELEREATERVLRASAAGGNAPTPGTASGRDKGTEGPKGTTPRDLGGEAAETALIGAGKDAEGVAKRLGYKSWEDYMEKTKDYR